MSSLVQEKSEEFAVRIINLYKFLSEEQYEYVMSKQILRSGTSIGANLAEAEYAISKSEYLSKVYVALKEANETLYWLRLLQKTKYLSESQYQSIYSDCEEIKKMLSAATKTMKERK